MKDVKVTKNKGFTLIELLAVIVIMGILLLVAIPAMTRYMENARKDTFIDTAKEYANSARNLWASDGLACGTDNTVSSAVEDGDYYIEINTASGSDAPNLLEQGGKSSWGNRDLQGYVHVNVSTSGTKRVTKFSVAVSDGTHGIKPSVTKEASALVRGDVSMKDAGAIAIPTGATTCVEN